MADQWDRTFPQEGSAADPVASAGFRTQVQCIDSSLWHKNLLADPTGRCWPFGDSVSINGTGIQFGGHWYGDGGAGALATRETTKANTFLQDPVAPMCFKVTYGTTVTRIYETLVAAGALPEHYRGQWFAIAAAVKASSLNQARLFLKNKATIDAAHYSAYHSGGGSYEWLVAAIQLDAAADRLIFGVENAASGDIWVDACVCVIGKIPPQVFVPAETIEGPIPFSLAGPWDETGGPNDNGTEYFAHVFEHPAVVTAAMAWCETAPTGGAAVIDLNKDGVSIFDTTKLEIASGATVGEQTTFASAYELRSFAGRNGTTITDAKLSGDIDEQGPTTAAEYGECNVTVLQWCPPRIGG